MADTSKKVFLVSLANSWDGYDFVDHLFVFETERKAEQFFMEKTWELQDDLGDSWEIRDKTLQYFFIENSKGDWYEVKLLIKELK